MLTTDQVSARQSTIGHYGFHYPDFSVAEVEIPTGTRLEAFSWSPQLGHQAFKWERDSGSIVIWIESEKLK